MRDIQVVRLSEVLPVDSIAGVPGVTPRSVMISGRNFENVEAVYLNNSMAPEFVVMSVRQILVQVPEDQVSQTIKEAYVLSTRLSYTAKSMIELTVGIRPQIAEGTLLLIQNFTRMLLRTPGTNVFSKSSGGGLFRRIGKNLTSRDEIGAEAAVSVSRTRQLFVSTQTPDRRIPPEERLLSAEIIGLNVSPQEGSIYMSVSITSHAGTSAAATIVR